MLNSSRRPGWLPKVPWQYRKKSRWQEYRDAVRERQPQLQVAQLPSFELDLWRPWVVGIAIGAGIAWLMTPTTGRRNRAMVRDKISHLWRVGPCRLAGLSNREAKYMRGKLRGLAHEVRNPFEPSQSQLPPDLDQSLKHRVETEVFRRPDSPKGDINIGAVSGVVTIRGTVASDELIDQIVSEVRMVEGVNGIVNLMKTPDEAENLAYTSPKR